jgi:aminopeptidase-like protein
MLGKYLSTLFLRYSYRIIIIPGTIGSIVWLSLNEDNVSRIKHGLVVSCVGDPGSLTYKRSRQGDAEIDRVAEYVLRHSGDAYDIVDFSPYGYDERQYCSPGFNLPVGCLQRTPHGRYPEYHTSADNRDFVQPAYLADSLSKYIETIELLETNRKYLNMNPKCEPQLGKRGLYTAVGGKSDRLINQTALLWVLNLSDGRHSLLDIAERSNIDFDIVRNAADALHRHKLLEEISEKSTTLNE